MKMANFFPLLCFLLLAIVLAYTTNLSEKPNFLPSLVGREMPVFETKDLMSDKTFGNKDFEDITIINLFASWCAPCKAEHHVIKDLSAKGHKIYGINVGDTQDDARKYLKEQGNPYVMVGFDPRRQVMIGLGSTGVPETYVVDKTGKIFFHQRGMIDAEIVEKQLLPIIEGMKRR